MCITPSAQTDTQRVSVCLPLPDYSYINSAGLHMQLVDSPERKNLVLYLVGAQHAEISKLVQRGHLDVRDVDERRDSMAIVNN